MKMKLSYWLVYNFDCDKTLYVSYKGTLIAYGNSLDLYNVLSSTLKDKEGLCDEVTFYIE